MSDLATLLTNPHLIADLSPHEAATALGRLAELQLALAARLHTPPERALSAEQSEPDRLLQPAEAAQRFGVTVRWLYAHADDLPFTKRLGRKTLRFSKAGLERYLAARNS